MGYVIAAILVVLIVAAGIAVWVRSATTRKGQATIAEPDEGTPVGDTSEHAGEQSRSGETVADPESSSRAEKPPSPGIGGPGQGGAGGEGEGSRPVEAETERRPVQPESERLADRPR
jgi:hypothetical protein